MYDRNTKFSKAMILQLKIEIKWQKKREIYGKSMAEESLKTKVSLFSLI